MSFDDDGFGDEGFGDEGFSLEGIMNICNDWDDPSVPSTIASMKNALLRDLSELNEEQMKENAELQVYENLILEISTPLFWKKLNLLLNLNYDY